MSQYRNNLINSNDKSFHIATCNMLNLAMPNRVFYENASPYTDEKYEKKLQGLADLLTHARSDIYALQEVWDEQALYDLTKKMSLSEANILAPLASNDPANALTSGQGASETPAQALISRFAIEDWQLLTDFDPLAVVEIPDVGSYTVFNRPPLVATLDIHGCSTTVISTHLKSKRPHYLRDDNGDLLEDYDDPKLRVRAKLRSLYMRAAEAAALRIFIIQTLKNTRHPLILLGDMNDVTDSVTTQLLAETSEVVYDKSMRDVVLFDAARVQTSYGWLKDVAYTHLHQGMPEVIDQLFVSEEFVIDSKFALGQVLRVDYFNDHLKSEYHERYTDHGIVRAKIVLN